MGAKETFFPTPPDKNVPAKGPQGANPQPKIVGDISTVLIPTNLGGAAVGIYAVGDDDKAYQWMGDIKAWVLA